MRACIGAGRHSRCRTSAAACSQKQQMHQQLPDNKHASYCCIAPGRLCPKAVQQQSAASTHGNKIARSPGGGVIIPGQDFEREVDADGGLWARGWRGGGGIDEEHMEGRWWRYYGGSSAGSGGCKGQVMDAAVAMMRVAVMMTIMMFHLVRG